MTPEEQNWAISDIVAGGLDPHTMSPCDGAEHLFIHRPNGDYECLDYTSDLNAMHEAEKVLDDSKLWDQQKIRYYHELSDLFNGCGENTVNYLNIATAAASQRAEAFLKTLNLWTNET